MRGSFRPDPDAMPGLRSSKRAPSPSNDDSPQGEWSWLSSGHHDARPPSAGALGWSSGCARDASRIASGATQRPAVLGQMGPSYPPPTTTEKSLRAGTTRRLSHGVQRESLRGNAPKASPANAAAALALCLTLSACATAKPAPTITVCAALVTYSAADQAKASAELKALPAGDVLARFIVDYAGLRAQVRAGCLTPPPN